jgi:hypothetical protein
MNLSQFKCSYWRHPRHILLSPSKGTWPAISVTLHEWMAIFQRIAQLQPPSSLPKTALQVQLSSPFLSPAMLYDRRHQLAIFDDGSHLLRNRLLIEFPLVTDRDTDVESTSLGCYNLGGSHAFLGEINLARVGGVDEDSRDQTEDLDREGRRGGD